MGNYSSTDLLLYSENAALGSFHYLEGSLFRFFHKTYIELFDCHILQLYLFSVPGFMKSKKLLAFEIVCSGVQWRLVFKLMILVASSCISLSCIFVTCLNLVASKHVRNKCTILGLR